MPLSAAVIVVLRMAAPAANPLLPLDLLTSAIVASAEAHVTNWVRSSAVPSEKTPVACSCTVVPSAMELLLGSIVIAVRRSVAPLRGNAFVSPVMGSAI